MKSIVLSRHYKEIRDIIAQKKYMFEGENCVDDIYKRVSTAIIEWIKENYPEEGYKRYLHRYGFKDLEDFKKFIFKLMSQGIYLPAGRVLAGMVPESWRKQNPEKYPRTTLMNCYVMRPPEDNMEDIMKVMFETANTFKRGGGAGIALDLLRPAGAKTHNAAKTSSGVPAFANLYSELTGTIGQSARRGALMLMLRSSHPDIMLFTIMKQELNENNLNLFYQIAGNDYKWRQEIVKNVLRQTQVRFANISIKAEDELFKAVKEDRKYLLYFENERVGVIKKEIPARELLMLIAQKAWESAEPGLFFIDTAKKYSTTEYIAETVATNPCLPGWVKVLTPNGLKDFKDIEVGDMIWSKEGWTKVVRKIYNGKKPVFRYITAHGYIDATKEHEVPTCKGKCQIGKATELEVFKYYDAYKFKDKLTFETRSTKILEKYLLGEFDVWDITVDNDSHTYWANGFDVSNCGEVPGGPYTSCNLGSINLAAFADTYKEHKWEEFRKVVGATILIHNVIIDYNNGHHPIEQQNEVSREQRRIGLGIMGLADYYLRLNVPYGEDEPARVIYSKLVYYAHEASINIAEDLNLRPTKLDLDKHFESQYFHRLANIIEGMDDLYERARKVGIANATLLSFAPTGTISLIAGVSSGIEPIFELEYYRFVSSMNKNLKIKHPAFEEWVKLHNYKDGKLPEYILTAHDIHYKRRVEAQALAQIFVDQSISSTTNLPSSATVDDIYNLYMYAWEKELKGITVYRDGSRAAVLTKDTSGEINIKDELVNEIMEEDLKGKSGNYETKKYWIIEKNEKYPEITLYNPTPKKPKFLSGNRYAFKVNGKTVYVSIFGYRKHPYEIFITDSDGKVESITLAFNKLLSKLLQAFPVEFTKQLLSMVKETLNEIETEEVNIQVLGERIKSKAQILGKALEWYINGIDPDREEEKIREALLNPSLLLVGFRNANSSYTTTNVTSDSSSIEIKQKEIRKQLKGQYVNLYGEIEGDKIPLDAIITICPNCKTKIIAKREYPFSCDQPCPVCGYSIKCD